MSGRQPKVSAVIACYRDAPAIPEMHERLTATFRKIGVAYEIIFVNDGSPDNAGEWGGGLHLGPDGIGGCRHRQQTDGYQIFEFHVSSPFTTRG